MLCSLNFCGRGGFAYDVLAHGHFVPGNDRYDLPRYRGKPVWKEILNISDEVCNLYFHRCHKSFNASVTVDFTQKMKARFLKFSNIKINFREQYYCYSLVTLWTWKKNGAPCLPEAAAAEPWHTRSNRGRLLPLELVEAKLETMLSSEYLGKLFEMFLAGILVFEIYFMELSEWIWDPQKPVKHTKPDLAHEKPSKKSNRIWPEKSHQKKNGFGRKKPVTPDDR